MTDGPYCRVYYSIKDDEKFDGIREDDHHLATWLRLLMAADAIWPASPDLPAAARRVSVKALVAAELVDILPGGRFRIRGLDAERMTRHENARVASNARWSAKRNADGNAARKPTRPRSETEQSKDRAKTEPSTTRARRDGPEPIAAILPSVIPSEPTEDPFGVSEEEGRVFAFLARFGAAIRPDQPLGRRLLGLMERRGVEEVLRRAGELSRNGAMSDRQWVLGLENVIEQIPTGKEGRELDAEEDRRKHSERVQAQMAERRREQARWTKPETVA